MPEIEQLNIGIDATVKGSPDKINKLAVSIEKLQNVLDRGISNLTNVTAQLNGLANLSSLKDAGKGINSLTNALTKLQGISFTGFSSKMESLTRGLEPLKNLQIGGISDFGKGISSLATGLTKLEKINIQNLASNITGVVNAIRPLTDEMLRGGNQASAYGQAMLAMAKASNVAGVSAQKTAPKVVSLTKSFAKFASLTFLLRKAVRFGTDMLEQTAAWTENLNLFAVSFGSQNYQAALDWTTDLAERFGYATNELVKFTATFKQLGNSLGIANETSSALSQTLTQLALDFSSLYNVSTQRTFETFQSAIFGGQTKGARLLFGVEVAYQSLDQTLENLAQTYVELTGVTSKQLTQAQKAELRAIEFLRAGENAMGDMARNINQLQSQLRVFEGGISNLKLAFGDLLINEPFQVILTHVNGLIIGLTYIIRAFSGLRTEVKNLPEDNLISGINEDLDEMNNKLGLLSFDVFNVLQTAGAENENLAITKALTAELERRSKLYQDILDAQTEIENKAISVGIAIRNWFIDVDVEGNFKGWTDQAKALGAAITALFSPIIIAGFSKLVLSIFGITKGMAAAQIASKLLTTVGIFALVFAIMQLTDKSKDLSPVLESLYVIIIAIAGTLAVLKLVKGIGLVVDKIGEWVLANISFKAGLDGVTTSITAQELATKRLNIASKLLATAGIFLVIYAITQLLLNYNDMDSKTKAVTITIGALGVALIILSNKTILQTTIKAFITLGTTITTTVLPAIASFIKSIAISMVAGIKTAITWLTSLSAATWVSIGAFAILGLAVFNLIANWDKMSGVERVVNIMLAVAAAATIAAISIAGLQSAWTLGLGAAAIVLGIAAIAMAINRTNKEAQQSAANIQNSVQFRADGGTFDTRGGMAIGVINERGRGELAFTNNAEQVEISNQTSLEESFFRALLRYHSMTAEEQQKLILEIRDKTTGGLFEQIMTPRIIREAKRIGAKL